MTLSTLHPPIQRAKRLTQPIQRALTATGCPDAAIQAYLTGDSAPLHRFLSTTPGGNPRNILGRSTKVEKGEKKGVLTAVVYLSPASEAGITMCHWATRGCAAACLGHSSGHLRYSSSRIARIGKTLWFHFFRADYLATLDLEIAKFVRRAERAGKIPALRLNGSSDVLWERHGVPQRHPTVQFYDYTKAPLQSRAALPPNYHLTFSISEKPESITEARHWLDAGHNAAIVVGDHAQTAEGGKALAQRLLKGTLYGYPTTDGDESDIRFRDPAGTLVLLYAKGAAVRDTSGFVYRLN